ncbi:MAG: pirin [Rhodospirillaceae bacterium BRH_c57]|nr:MAG: pirin [Rhodospirillaceae bacterium BRH_c57]
MADIHDKITELGLEVVRDNAASKNERTVAGIAAALLTDELGEMGVSHSGFALTSLPHKAVIEPLWIKEGHKVTLHIESGRSIEGDHIGVPYGSKARMILLYLQTEALKTNSPEIELGKSMHAWLSRMGVPIGGATYKLISEQSRRISACRLTFFRELEGSKENARMNGAFVDVEIPMHTVRDADQLSLWQETVRLNDRFFQSLKDHAIPLRDEALRQLSNKSLSLDVYIWLAYRLHSLQQPTSVSWAALYRQFGGGYRYVRQFRPKFKEALQFALAAYPEAKVSVEEEGIRLFQSRPPVNKRVYALS